MDSDAMATDPSFNQLIYALVRAIPYGKVLNYGRVSDLLVPAEGISIQVKATGGQGFQELKKNDRVQTIGGIIGTVVSTKGDEVTLRVDESNNTKLTLVRKAIQHVLTDQSQPQGQ